ncbi:MAG: ferrous iron transport protein B [Opitutae bacterium]|jgi:ferrous iron transport protein B|nr:ferrous iron transport protein B [Opitutae bacterium]
MNNGLSTIALIGNPNTGKTSLFNALTGQKQRVGNYPGVTVEKKSGLWKLNQSESVTVIDLPGTYSLSAQTIDERITVDVLSGNIPDLSPSLMVIVIDAENLQRNLFLASQASELGLPIVIALNCWDIAERKGIQIDSKLLEKRLGVPVVPTVANQAKGIESLASAVKTALNNQSIMVRPKWPEPVQKAIETLKEDLSQIDEASQALSNGEVQRLIFDASSAVTERIKGDKLEISGAINKAKETIHKGGFHPNAVESIIRFRFLKPILADIIARQATLKKASHSESIDQLLLHRFWGLVIFVGMMYFVFQSVYSWSGPLMQLIEGGIAQVQSVAASALEATPMLQSLIVDGILSGVGAFVIFLPQILVLFLFISLLEETGYMARAAFLMDKLFQWCGLNGKSFVPLLSSYACAIPGILATRTINDKKIRIITIMIAPLMSCSARLPIYILMIGIFVEPTYGPAISGITLFFMHFIGVLVAAPAAYLLNKCIQRKTISTPFVMELPRYRVPNLKSIYERIYESGYAFITSAGTLIFAFTIIIWALFYFPRPAALETEIRNQNTVELFEEANLQAKIDSAYLEQSYGGQLGKTLQPIFNSSGYDWKITVAVIASFPAREVIIATLGILYSLGGEMDENSRDLRASLKNATWEDGKRKGMPVLNIAVAFSIMIFFALCMQCGATVAIIAQELNWLWAIGSFVTLSFIAWIASILTYQSINFFL